MPVIQVAEWMPDAAALGNPGAIQITNAVPGATSYKPFRQLNPVAGATDDRPRGAITARDEDLNIFNYAGDEAKLYTLTAAAWVDASKAGGYVTATSEVWEFVRWKNKILATNFNDNPQQITMGALLFSDLTTDFRARHLAVIRDHVFAANTFDSTDGNVIDRVRWSAFNDETDWTVSPATQSDFRDLKTGGPIQRVVGGEYGVIVSERSTFRVSWTGDLTVFQIDEVLPDVGAVSGGAVTHLGDTVFFLSDHGFISLTGATGSNFIGAGKVDGFVQQDLDADYLDRISSVSDPKSGRIAWAYPGAGNTSGQPNRIIIYDSVFNKWALIDESVELLWRAAGVGITLEGLDAISASLDGLGTSLDSAAWKGGAVQLAAFDTEYKHGFFDGQKMQAVVETKETEIHQGSRTRLNSFVPLVDSSLPVTAQVGSRNRQSDPVVFGPSLNLSSTGRFTTRSNAKYHRFRLTINGDWEDAIGVQVEAHDARKAERRG